MGKIFYIFGKSASGKDSIYQRLLNDPEIALQNVVLYTTRPIRTGEREGVEYHFIDEREAVRLSAAGLVIEERAYRTIYGIWKYMTVQDEAFDLNKGSFLMTGTLASYLSIRQFFGDEKVVPFYVYVDDGVRLQRALLREQAQAEPKYAEMCRRFLADEEDFAEEKLAAAGITTGYENADLDTCTARILEEIKRYTRGE